MRVITRRAAVVAALVGASLLSAACAGESAPASAAETGTAASAAAAPSPTTAPVAASAGAAAMLSSASHVTVYKSPTCGCCKAWVDHLREHGFTVTERDTADMAAVKKAHGVTANLESCHTGVVDGYVIEGHVPADLVARLLTEKPAVAGLAVPGMPAGSPGMEMGNRKDAYDVLAFGKDGRTTVFAKR